MVAPGGSSLLRGAHPKPLKLEIHVSGAQERSASGARAFGSPASIAATIEAPFGSLSKAC